MARVSVIIPNYNHGCYLKQRIDSVLKQTYQDFEIIIMDDCSPDNSRDIIAAYENHPKVTNILLNETNSGSTFKQWQKGINAAKGDYIWIAESDDWCEPTLLETLMDGLLADKSVGLAFCQSYYYYEPNKIKEITYYPYYVQTENGERFIQQHMLEGNSVVNASMAVWKKELYRKVDPEYTQFKFCGDWLFWISILQQSNVFVSGRALNYFRNHDKDVSSKFYHTGNNFIENIDLYKILLQRSIIDKSQFEKLIKKQYLNFLSVKDSILKSNLNTISNAFSNHSNLSNSKKAFYNIKKRLYIFKELMLAKPAH
jgi:glycosyltransferase involved in cell wall biosynthesis